MKPGIAALFWNPRIPSAVNAGLWIMVGVMAIGVAIASVGGYVVMGSSLCDAFWLMTAGFLIVGVGPLVGGLVMLREWRDIDLRTRVGAAMFTICGIGLVIIVIKLMVSHSGRC